MLASASKRMDGRSRLALGASLVGAVAGLLSACGVDVVVGINRVREESTADAAIDRAEPPDGGDGDASVEPSSLLAVRRGPTEHAAAGIVRCTSADDPACDGWLTSVSGLPSVVERVRFGGAGADAVRSLAFVGPDPIVVGTRGAPTVGAWLARTSGGGVTWELPLSSQASAPSSGRGVDIAPDGVVVALGRETVAGAEVGFVARVSADGALLSRVRLDSAPSTKDAAVDVVAVLVDGKIYVGGSRRVVEDGGAADVPVVIELAADLTLFGSSTGAGLPGEGSVRGLLAERSAEITACAQSGDGVGVVRMRDSLDVEYASRVIAEPNARVVLGGCVVADDGAIVLVGTRDGSPPRPWAAKLDRLSLAPTWTRTYTTLSGRLTAVAPAANGATLAVGTRGASAFALTIEP